MNFLGVRGGGLIAVLCVVTLGVVGVNGAENKTIPSLYNLEMRAYLPPNETEYSAMCAIYYDFFSVPTSKVVLEDFRDKGPCSGEQQQKSSLSTNTTPRILLFNKIENCSVEEYWNLTIQEKADGLAIIYDKKIFSLRNYTKDAIPKEIEYMFQLSEKQAQKLPQQEKTLTVSFAFIDDQGGFEWATFVLGLTACFCVIIGALTAPYYDPLHRQRTHQQILEEGSSGEIAANHHQVHFTVKVALLMVTFVTGVLLLLYFFYDYLVYFFMAVFCIATGRALFENGKQVMEVFCGLHERMIKVKGCGLHLIILGAICIAAPITWFFLRHAEHIWILEDILGINFCIHLIQTMKLPSLKICTVLLSFLFVYDIFFVFITPYFTSDGKSIMVEVATGGGSGESLPLLLKVPHFGAYSVCSGSRGFSLLGFGDIILPGFLVSFVHTYDLLQGDTRRPYFITAMIGYTVGLFGAFVALFLTNTGQPALLYIVPAMLIPIFIVSLIRKQFSDIWRGEVPTIVT